ncbi:hypothetical protein AQJ11_34925 [Streptomyces corchorusii]|uniref:Uncharacterized protein n=1 Tax=Streptomyces corchorusii TaxID=1903 RepID=A0A117QAW8_STRCK|nr:hypothetical protein AQJ11_34925 [Streptomyces corchorusii]
MTRAARVIVGIGMHKFTESEFTRYLSLPGQALGCKLGERAWLPGREKARERNGGSFELRARHTAAALSQGSLGLDDLVDELARR